MNYDDNITSCSGTSFQDETPKEFDSGGIGAMALSCQVRSSEVGMGSQFQEQGSGTDTRYGLDRVDVSA
jgi:hypothetical protein